MNKFKKKSKTKGLALGIAILSSAAVVSTGFAAWVISGGDTKTAPGNIEADTVSNKYHTLSEVNFTKDKIFFGAPEGDTSKGSHISNDSADKQNLVATATFTVGNVESDPDDIKTLFDEDNCIFSETTDASTDASLKFATAVTNKYVASMPEKVSFEKPTDSSSAGAYIYKDDTGYDSKEKTLSCSLEVIFKWGEAFGGENPYNYFNDKGAASISSAAGILESLSKMKAKFTVTIVAE